MLRSADGLAESGLHMAAPMLSHCAGDTHRRFGLTGYLADDRVSLEAVGTEDTGKDTGFTDEADAVGNADAVRTDFPGKFHDFLHAGPLAVAFVFYFRTGNHNLAVASLVVTLQCPLAVFLLQIFRGTEIRIGAVLVFAVLCAAVYAGRGGMIVLFVFLYHYSNLSFLLFISSKQARNASSTFLTG